MNLCDTSGKCEVDEPFRVTPGLAGVDVLAGACSVPDRIWHVAHTADVASTAHLQCEMCTNEHAASSRVLLG